MSAIADQARQGVLHPLQAFLLAATVPPFVGAAMSDYAYTSTYQVQWINFSSWLIVGGLVFGGAALVWALVGLLRSDRRGATARRTSCSSRWISSPGWRPSCRRRACI